VDAREKAFETRYYTADIHQGTLATPPFVAAALGE
jgi:spermidine synthase